ncbi:MAG: (Fe-S)-binding protein [Chloroflexota bacterium]|nr:MAG: (Fe-S)-binding protein [Chloroflexota bacterium]
MDKPDRVALCVTCLVDQLYPEIGVATVKILRRAGCQVDFPAEQTCCGQPFFNSGFRRQAAGLARRTIEIFEPYKAVVLPSGSCTSMIRLEYIHLLEDEPAWRDRAERLAAKTFELSDFLVNQLGWTPADVLANRPPSVTYHDSCHMCRSLGLSQEPRQLLNGVGYSLHEMEEADRCCGFGGLFSARMPEVSTAMAAEKLRQAAETEATTLVTADPGCLMQMRGLAGEEGSPIEHLATILEEATNPAPSF